MVTLTVQGTHIFGTSDSPLTSGSVGVMSKFIFDSTWKNLTRIAVFKCGNVGKDVYLDDKDECEIPWEIFSKQNIGEPIDIGVYGMYETEIIVPTIYTNVGRLLQGTSPSGNPVVPPTPELVAQLIQEMKDTKEIAQSVRDDADNGEFNGYSPVRGKDYWTPEDQETIVNEVLAQFPNGDEVAY